jgi:hypothetical protein
VLDLLDDAGGEFLSLEDGDQITIMEAINDFPWSVANRDILAIIDDVKNAAAVKASKKT